MQNDRWQSGAAARMLMAIALGVVTFGTAQAEGMPGVGTVEVTQVVPLDAARLRPAAPEVQDVVELGYHWINVMQDMRITARYEALSVTYAGTNAGQRAYTVTDTFNGVRETSTVVCVDEYSWHYECSRCERADCDHTAVVERARSEFEDGDAEMGRGYY